VGECQYYIYILYSIVSNRYYVGYSSNPWNRLIEHNNDLHNTYTSKHRPWELKSVFLVGTVESLAMKIEKLIKKQKSRTLIEKLLDPTFIPDGQLAQLVRVPHVRD
jgi:putative endonuclease